MMLGVLEPVSFLTKASGWKNCNLKIQSLDRHVSADKLPYDTAESRRSLTKMAAGSPCNRLETITLDREAPLETLPGIFKTKPFGEFEQNMKEQPNQLVHNAGFCLQIKSNAHSPLMRD